MKKVCLVFALVTVTLSGSASIVMADSASYNVAGTYGSGTPSTPLSAPGQSFTMSFTIPTNPPVTDFLAGDDFFVNPVSVAYSLGGSPSTTLMNVVVIFYSVGAMSQSGGFFVDFCASGPMCLSGNEYQWQFAGPKQYTGPESNPTMTPTGFNLIGQASCSSVSSCLLVFDNSHGGASVGAGATSGTVSVGTVSTPEPSALVMLLAGLAASALLLKKLV
jgi:hypothetical protein